MSCAYVTTSETLTHVCFSLFSLLVSICSPLVWFLKYDWKDFLDFLRWITLHNVHHVRECILNGPDVHPEYVRCFSLSLERKSSFSRFRANFVELKDARVKHLSSCAWHAWSSCVRTQGLWTHLEAGTWEKKFDSGCHSPLVAFSWYHVLGR